MGYGMPTSTSGYFILNVTGATRSFQHENNTIRFAFKKLILSVEGTTGWSTEKPSDRKCCWAAAAAPKGEEGVFHENRGGTL